MTPPFKPIPDQLAGPPGSKAVLGQVYASQIGYREGWNNDTAFGVWYPGNFQPWCAYFISWGAWHAGVSTDVIPKHGYTPSGAAWFKARGQLFTTPQVGDIGYVYYPSKGRIGHVFFIEALRYVGAAAIMTTIEGNTNDTGSEQGNGVYRLIRGDTDNLFYGRPAYAAVPDVPQVPPMSEEDDMPMVLVPPGATVRIPVGENDMVAISHSSDIGTSLYIEATDVNDIAYKPDAWRAFYTGDNKLPMPRGKQSVSGLRIGSRTVMARNSFDGILSVYLYKKA